jgi:hypothetical protein
MSIARVAAIAHPPRAPRTRHGMLMTSVDRNRWKNTLLERCLTRVSQEREHLVASARERRHRHAAAAAEAEAAGRLDHDQSQGLVQSWNSNHSAPSEDAQSSIAATAASAHECADDDIESPREALRSSFAGILAEEVRKRIVAPI